MSYCLVDPVSETSAKSSGSPVLLSTSPHSSLGCGADASVVPICWNVEGSKPSRRLAREEPIGGGNGPSVAWPVLAEKLQEAAVRSTTPLRSFALLVTLTGICRSSRQDASITAFELFAGCPALVQTLESQRASATQFRSFARPSGRVRYF